MESYFHNSAILQLAVKVKVIDAAASTVLIPLGRQKMVKNKCVSKCYEMNRALIIFLGEVNLPRARVE